MRSWRATCETYRSGCHRKTPLLESLFNYVAGLKACHFIKKRLQRRCFPVFIAKFLRIAFLPNTSGGCFWTDCTNMGVCDIHLEIKSLKLIGASILKNLHSVKSVQIRSFFWSVFSYIRTEYRKIRTRENFVFGHFSRSVKLKYLASWWLTLNSTIQWKTWTSLL